MSKIINIALIGSFAGLWVATLFSGQTELILGFFLILTFGIIHGSNDILLIEKLINKKKKRSQATSLLFYVLTVLSTFFAFYLIPSLTLLLFILFSAYHFGEQHWEEKITINKKVMVLPFQTSYGALILFILFSFNISEVQEIVKVITGYALPEQVIRLSLVIIIGIFISSLLFITYRDHSLKEKLLKELFFIGLLALIFKMSSLIWGFTIYFVLWHSLPSLYDQINFIYGKSGGKEIWSYLRNALPYWIISLIGITVSYFWFKENVLFYGIFFSFIAAVTFPHSLIISRMFAKKKHLNP